MSVMRSDDTKGMMASLKFSALHVGDLTLYWAKMTAKTVFEQVSRFSSEAAPAPIEGQAV
jgi:hypothetical protein